MNHLPKVVLLVSAGWLFAELSAKKASRRSNSEPLFCADICASTARRSPKHLDVQVVLEACSKVVRLDLSECLAKQDMF